MVVKLNIAFTVIDLVHLVYKIDELFVDYGEYDGSILQAETSEPIFSAFHYIPIRGCAD